MCQFSNFISCIKHELILGENIKQTHFSLFLCADYSPNYLIWTLTPSEMLIWLMQIIFASNSQHHNLFYRVDWP